MNPEIAADAEVGAAGNTGSRGRGSGGAAGKVALVIAVLALLGDGALGYMNFQLKRENTLLRVQVDELSRRVDRLNEALDATTKLFAAAQAAASQFKDLLKDGGGVAQLFGGTGDEGSGAGGGADFSNAGSALANLMKAFSGLGQGGGDTPPMPTLPGLDGGAGGDDTPPGPGPKVSRAEAKTLLSDADKLRCGRAEPSVEPLGLKLFRVREGSICAVLGLRAGDVITEADGLPVATPAGVKRLLEMWRGELDTGKQSFGYKFVRNGNAYESAMTVSE